MKLIKVPGSRLVNLDNVSSVGFKTMPEGDTKVIVNYSHSITLKNGNMVADYTYIYFNQSLEESFNDIVRAMGSTALVSTDKSHYVINAEKVANIAFDVEKKRVIFNLNYSKEIQLSGGVYTISSDFCYWDFQTEDEFDENVKNLVNMASNISI